MTKRRNFPGSGCTGVHGDKFEESQEIQKRANYSKLGEVVSNILYVHPYLGKIPIN